MIRCPVCAFRYGFWDGLEPAQKLLAAAVPALYVVLMVLFAFLYRYHYHWLVQGRLEQFSWYRRPSGCPVAHWRVLRSYPSP